VPHAAAIQTEVFEQMAEKQGKPLPELMEHMAKMHAMKRVGQPEEIAAPIVFLASNAGATFVRYLRACSLASQ